ncbi:hypothetical protein OYC64_001249 [Pagothenia borchgrevinki]|uniref:Ig-like domain-containing protein n=1 Tax=Pagothenia borchgrevinki TaxID=8213 RepID=A0ABD2G9Y2_PAGBO
MAALTSAQHAGLFMFLWIIGSAAARESLKRKSGEDVLLRCNSSTDAAITKLEWKRPELDDDYVFFFRNNRLYENYQDPRYRGRVELNDPEMKNGDASVLLKNVTVNDSGTYECWVITSQTRRRRAADEKPVSSVHLSVSEGPEHPGGPRGYVGLGVVLVCLIVVGGAVVVGLVVKSQRAKLNRPLERVDEQVNVELNPRHVPDLFTLDCFRSPASKLNHLLPESLP